MAFSSIRSALIAMTLLACGLVLADDAPRFPIETISIEGAKYTSTRILIAESKLVEGREYTEGELRDAISRINRLPYVIRTDFRLEKGSERGRYVLVVKIIETKPLFVSYRGLQEAIDTQRVVRVIGRPPNETIEYEKYLFRHNEDYFTAGGRMFLGTKGVAHLSVDHRGGTRFNLGYTHYDVLGTHASISAIVTYREYSFDYPPIIGAQGRRDLSFADHLAYEVTGAIPLFGNNGLRATWYRQRDPFIYESAIIGGQRITRATWDHSEVSWVYDSTNDLLFPTRGTFIKGGLQSDRILRQLPGLTIEPDYVWHHEIVGTAARYFELTPAQSLSTTVNLLTLNDRDIRTWTLRLGYAANLLSRKQSERYGDIRVELEAERNLLHFDDRSSYGAARVGLAYRSEWGIARLDFRYIGWRHTPQ